MVSQNEKNLMFIIIALLVIVLIGIFSDQTVLSRQFHVRDGGRPKDPRQGSLTKENLKTINRSLQEVNKKRELEAMRVQIENQMTAQQLEASSLSSTEREQAISGGAPAPIDLVGEDRAVKVYQAAKSQNRRYEIDSLPPERIDQTLELRRFVGEYDKKLNQAYMRTFLENAQRDGLVVQLNEAGEVMGVRKLAPQRPMLFPTPNSNSRADQQN